MMDPPTTTTADGGGSLATSQLLLIVLAKPPLTSDEIKWKKGVRQDNRVKLRRGEMLKKVRRCLREPAVAAAARPSGYR